MSSSATRPRVFLLSPATCGGPRATLLGRPGATLGLAARLRSPDGAPIGEVMAFLSRLYFRGKLAYARAFARPPGQVPGAAGALVITPHAGLLPVDARFTATDLRAAARVEIDPRNPRYRRPLEVSAAVIRAAIGGDCDVVLLGSVATGKYVEPLSGVFGARLAFPLDFVGRGDMSRGGLMLRCVREGRELRYVPLDDLTPRQGPRPPKLGALPAAGARA
jgi:hypothetical protein